MTFIRLLFMLYNMQWYPANDNIQEDGPITINLPPGDPANGWKDIADEDKAVSPPYRKGRTIYQLILFESWVYLYCISNQFHPPNPYPECIYPYAVDTLLTADSTIFPSTITHHYYLEQPVWDISPGWGVAELPDELVPEGWTKSGQFPQMLNWTEPPLEEVTFEGTVGRYLTQEYHAGQWLPKIVGGWHTRLRKPLLRCNMLATNPSFDEYLDDVVCFHPDSQPHDLQEDLKWVVSRFGKASIMESGRLSQQAVYEVLINGGVTCLTLATTQSSCSGVNPYYMMLPLAGMAFMQGGQTIFRKKR